MRAFIALELPRQIKTEIGKIQQELKKMGIQAKWINPEIVHLTLAFLGSITSDKIELIGKILEEVSYQIKAVKLKLYQVGCFPSPTKARIIFVNLQGELGKLNALAIKIRKRLKKEKIYFDEKPFAAHITLGRVKDHQNLTEKINKVKVKKSEFITDEIALTESQLTKNGPIYTTLKDVFL